ncbi:hypothetical protein ACFYRN_40065 [Streptomyces sp. NPDC005227]|uniref:hypothetical protein n=1 Tax=Streptomyces sp. NPDC005227 TaxID=3364707 RepID=UPI0036C0B7CD
MKDTLNSHPASLGTPPRPFLADPGRWETERSRALRTGHRRDGACSPDCRPVLVYERGRWGWLAWTIPDDGTIPTAPHHVGVLDPTATRIQSLAVRWLTRRPAHRVALHPSIPGSLRLWALAVALTSLVLGLSAMAHGAPWDVALPVMLLAPMLAEHLPGHLDARARQHVRTVEGDAAVRYLQRLSRVQTVLTGAATGTDRHELRRPAEIGQHVLWDAAGLLQTEDTRTVSAGLIARERLMVQLAHQVTSAHTLLTDPAGPRQRRGAARPLGPYPPAPNPSTEQGPHPAHGHPRPKGSFLMPHRDDTARSTDVFLLFAHEPYYPDNGVQEINTTVVAADTLLHPQVKQPDGARIHDLLTRGRRSDGVVPLATLTHELGSGDNWLTVGDFERVTVDLVALVRRQQCDALSLELSAVERALVCKGPGADQEVRIFDCATGDFIAYQQDDRAAVVAEVRRILTAIKPERPLWPGDHLLPALGPRA